MNFLLGMRFLVAWLFVGVALAGCGGPPLPQPAILTLDPVGPDLAALSAVISGQARGTSTVRISVEYEGIKTPVTTINPAKNHRFEAVVPLERGPNVIFAEAMAGGKALVDSANVYRFSNAQIGVVVWTSDSESTGFIDFQRYWFDPRQRADQVYAVYQAPRVGPSYALMDWLVTYGAAEGIPLDWEHVPENPYGGLPHGFSLRGIGPYQAANWTVGEQGTVAASGMIRNARESSEFMNFRAMEDGDCIHAYLLADPDAPYGAGQPC